MMDTREVLLRNHVPKDCIWEDMRMLDNATFEMIFNAMDEHGKQMSLSFLKYALEKMGGHSVDAAGNVEIKYKGEWLTPEQLFENFL